MKEHLLALVGILGILLAINFVDASEYLVKTNNPESLKSLGQIERITDTIYKVYSENPVAEKNLSLMSEILHVEEEQTYTIEMGAPSLTSQEIDSLWGLTGDHGVKAKEAWKISEGSEEIVIAVIDTGIDFNHPDLKDNLWINEAELNGTEGVDDDGNGYVDDIYGYNFAVGNGSPMDGNGHGTHCAGTIGAVHNGEGVAGVMKKVKLMGVKFLTDSGSGQTSNAIKSIEYARLNGAHIMSNSWGGGGYSQLLDEEIQKAISEGIIFIAAAGNSRQDNDRRASYPANYEGVISVASHTKTGAISSFSSFGLETVHISAPGSDIKSTWKGGGYSTISGTSMATPHVSGAVGLLLAKDSSLTPTEVKEKLIDSAAKRDSLTKKVKSEGILDAEALLK